LRGDGGKLSRVGCGRLRQNLAVEFDAGQLQSVHEFAVGEASLARGGADANDPQRAEITLLAFTADIGEFQRAFHGFLRGTVQFALG
jgi:hypothetical protein